MKTDTPIESCFSPAADSLPAETPSGETLADDKEVLGRAQSHMSSLRSKLVLSLAAVFFLFLLVDELVRRTVIQPEFLALEKAGAVRDTQRVLAAIETEVDCLRLQADHLATRIIDWHRFGEVIPPLNLDPVDDSSGRIDFAAKFDRAGGWQDLDFFTTERRDPSPPISTDALAGLINHSRVVDNPRLGGLTRSRDGSLWIFALVRLAGLEGQFSERDRDLTNSLSSRQAEIPPQEDLLLIMREFDSVLLTQLRERIQVDFALRPPLSLPSDRLPIGESRTEQETVGWKTDPHTLVAKAKLTGVLNQTLANLYVKVPREVAARSDRTIALARNSFIFGSVVALLMLLLLLQRIVIRPLKAIRQHSDNIAAKGMATESLVVHSNDEIGQLATAFDKMMSRLNETQEQLSKASQAAGRSQVASAVIHNVGNVLTNVNSLIDAAGHQIGNLRIRPLNKLALRLRDASKDDGLLAATPDYLENLAGSLAADQQSINDLLKTLDENVQHIHGIIQAQREHTGHDLKPTRVQLNKVIDEAIACCRARLREDSIEVSVDGSLTEQIRTDRSLLLQTIINLITNARHAMRDRSPADRRLSIEVAAINDHIQIQFRDSGCGMSSETLRQVFDAHFTTRENGTGLGLHFCAITLKRLGGSIAASSPGEGQGATFTIFLPHTINSMEETSIQVTESKSP